MNKQTKKQRQQNQYAERKNAGVCVVCKNPAKPNHTQCTKCLNLQQARYQKKKKQLLDQMLKKGKMIFFTNKELDELKWIMSLVIDTQKYSKPGEKELVEKICTKLNKGDQNR